MLVQTKQEQFNMEVASLELCKKLYALSQWNGSHWWFKTWDGENWQLGTYEADVPECYPAYDLGYLLRKLPKGASILHIDSHDELWQYEWINWDDRSRYLRQAASPEDAAAKLAIELFKQGVLTRGDAR